MASPSPSPNPSKSKPAVLLLGTIDHPTARATFSSLSSIADIITPSSTTRAEFLDECASGRFDNVRVVYRTFHSIEITGRWDEELARAMARVGIRFVCSNGAGYDQLDIPACTNHKIHVSNVPFAVNDATADTAVFLILSALRGFNFSLLALRRSEWWGIVPPPLGHDPQGKILGILGMGGIGRNLKRKMEVFGMKVQYHNRKELEEEFSEGAKFVGFEELLRTSDVVSLNLPLNLHTRHISTPQFTKMKKGVVIVNTARGGVMDEAALVKALDEGIVESVGLDVFENEPKIHPGLMANEKVTLLPHMRTWTVETQTAMEEFCISNVRMALEEEKLRSPVPEQADMLYH